MFEAIFSIVLAFYLVQVVIVLMGTKKTYHKIPENDLLPITIIVAVRNEEKNMMRCLNYLDKLVYPKDKLEIIISNNGSIDNTGQIIEDHIKGKSQYKHLIPSPGNGRLQGKINALAKAIKIAKGDIILTTDADCAVTPTWAKTIASYYQKDVAMVMGFTTQETYNQFSGMQMLDFIYLLSLASGFMNMNYPLSAIGSNMSFRKSVYEAVGGFESIPFCVTEDFKLVQVVSRLKKYKIIFPVDIDSLVVSEPCEDFKTLYRQKKRWGVGGLEGDMLGFSVAGVTFLSFLGLVLTPIFFSYIALGLALTRIGLDFLSIYPVLKHLRLVDKLKYFLSFELYFILYVLALPFVLLKSRKVIWKDKTFEGNEKPVAS